MKYTCKKISLCLLCFFMYFAVFGCGGKDNSVKKDAVQEESYEKESKDIVLSKEQRETANIQVKPVSRRTLVNEVSFPGKIAANEAALTHVSPRIAGRAVAVYGNVGDDVKKGQTLATVDSPELAQAQSAYLKANIALTVAEKSYERAKYLLSEKVISIGEFQRREGEYLTTKAEAKAAEDTLHLLGMTDKQIASTGKTHTLKSTVSISAPLSGTIIERHLTAGEVVGPENALFVIANLSMVWVLADVPEEGIAKIKKGQYVKVTVTSYPDNVFGGKIQYLSSTLDPATRTLKIRVNVKNSDHMLKPEMFATVNVYLEEKQGLLSVPESAIQRDGEKVIVFVEKEKNRFERRDVRTGSESHGFYEVLSGVSEGENVVVNGAFVLKSMMLKELMEEE